MEKKMKKILLASCLSVALSSCAVERFGRLTNLTETEKQNFTCKDIKIEIAKAEEFTKNVKTARGEVKATHVLGFMGDFGIGNHMEGSAAEASGEQRLSDLRMLKDNKGCK
jgi:hypothetical protein